MKPRLFALIAAVCVMWPGISHAGYGGNVLRDGWGVSVQTDFDVESVADGGYFPTSILARPDFVQSSVGSSWSVGASALYVWHPLRACRPDFARHFFVRFGLGGEYNKFGNAENFMFNARVHLGYTFTFSRVSLDVFTGPLGKIAPKKDEYTGPLGFVPDDGVTPVGTIKRYMGGFVWQFGVGLNVSDWGLFVSYNQPVGNFEHYRVVDSEPGMWVPSNHRQLKSLSVGVQYRF